MFTTSLGLLIRSLLLNILIPCLAWVLFIWLVFGTKFKWFLFHFLARFIGVGVVAHWLFNLQFIWFGIWFVEYAILLIVLMAGLLTKIYIKKEKFSNYLETLKVSFSFVAIKTSYLSLTKGEKIITRLASWLTVWFIITSFLFTTNFPSYADDSFWNRNRPVINILHDGGVKLFGEKDEILARGRLGYPIHIPLFKALIADFQGGYNDIYIDLFQRLCFFFGLGFMIVITRQKTKSIMYTLIPVWLICSLPLVFIHSVEGYYDLPVTIFALIALWFLYTYVKTRDLTMLTGSILIWVILSYIKIEGLIIYFPALIITLFAIIIWEWSFANRLKDFFTNTKSIATTVWYLIFFLLPFQIVRIFHGLWFNPSSLETGEVLDSTVHREIFKTFKWLFFQEDNYAVALIITVLSLYLLKKCIQKKDYAGGMLITAPLVIFILFTLVFLLTNNYQRVLNQTTVNRVYTMCFVMLFAFIWLTIHETK